MFLPLASWCQLVREAEQEDESEKASLFLSFFDSLVWMFLRWFPACGTKTGEMRVGMFGALWEDLSTETSSMVEQWKRRLQEAAKVSPKPSAHEASSRISSFLVALWFWDWLRVVSKSWDRRCSSSWATTPQEWWWLVRWGDRFLSVFLLCLWVKVLYHVALAETGFH